MSRKNVIFVLTDDQGYGDLGCTGNPWLQTPNIDSFYEDSVRMCNYHVGPTCAPTRSGLMTGHYANSTGVWHTIGGRSLLREDEWTIASALQEQGYRTGIFGKWHLGDSYPYRPEDRGFQDIVVHGGGGISQTPDYWGNDYFNDTYRTNDGYKKFDGYCTDVFYSEAKKFIKESHEKDEPFFCYLATNAPHIPYNVEDKYADLYRGKVMEERARFYGMITNIDDNFGALNDYIKELGIEDDTIVVFMTDNGSSQALTYDVDGNILEGYNAGLKGMKNSEYDGGHRVPFFIRCPELNMVGGTDVSTLCANVDFMPTILDLCDVSYDKSQFHGVSLKETISEQSEALVDRCIVTDSQRVANPIKWRKSAVMQGEYRLINGYELYDLSNDWGQDNDIAASMPEKVEELRAAYEVWWDLVSVKFEDPIPLHLHEETHLCAHDWRGDENNCVWNQGQVRAGRMTAGYWEVLAETDCKYVVEFYRWPEETGYNLTQGIEGNDCDYHETFVMKEFHSFYRDGKALHLHRADLIVDDTVLESKSISDDMSKVVFELSLTKGIHKVQGMFTDKLNFEVGAYYAIIRNL
ncbi:MAG: arylsulfatase [Eubacteriales bacterium]